MNDSEPTATKVEKHIRVHNAIRDMSGLLYKADGIIERITGPRPECAVDDAKQPHPIIPSLLDVLNESPCLIIEKIEGLHQKLDQIEELIF